MFDLLRITALSVSLAALVPVWAAVIEDLRVEQALTSVNQTWQPAGEVVIRFTLGKAAEVDVTITRRGFGELAKDGTFNGDTVPVKRIRKKFDKGAQKLVWDGLDEQGQAVYEQTRTAVPVGSTKMPDPAFTHVPVNRFRISVQSSGESQARSFERVQGAFDPNKSVITFKGASWTPTGEIVVADRASWRGRRFAAGWRLTGTFPEFSAGHSSDPVECFDAVADAKGRTYIVSGRGIYRYGPDNMPVAFSADEPQNIYPYPSEVRNVLGLRVDPGRGTYDEVFGPGGTGQHRKIDAKALAGTPGFTAGMFSGVAVAADGTVFVGAYNNVGKPEIKHQVWAFDENGKFLRELALPAKAWPGCMRMGTDGTLWLVCFEGLFGLDPQSGAQRKHVPFYGKGMHIGADGAIYLYERDYIKRLSATGDPKPFTGKGLPLLDGDASTIALGPDRAKVPDTAAGFTPRIKSVVGMKDGTFYVSASPHEDDNHRANRLLHFAADGTYLPEEISVDVLARQPYHVFVDQTQAVVDLSVTSIADADVPLTATWTLTDFDGKDSSGTVKLVAKPGARQTLPLILGANQNGHYRVKIAVQRGSETIFERSLMMARIRRHDAAPDPDSPFAMCWGFQPQLMGLAGVKLERVPDSYWGNEELVEGQLAPMVPDDRVKQGTGNGWWGDSPNGWRNYASQWNIAVPGGFSYGEQWWGGSYPNCRIFSYDRFIAMMDRTVDRLAPRKPPYYQFWNEPNFFWHVPGKFSREHFVLMGKHAWSVVKARDKDALAIPDGDAGGLGMMNEFAAAGGAPFNDAVQIHYPGVSPLAFDNMTAPEAPESKLTMVRDLIALRDAKYPGKPIWNTEEGWWGAKKKSFDMGAWALPRIYISQMAAGVEKIYWFCMEGEADSLTDGATLSPHATYASFAAMTRALGGAQYLGQVDTKSGVFAYLFTRGPDVVLAAWSAVGEAQIAFELGATTVTIADLMDRTSERKVTKTLDLSLNDRVQYLTFPRNAWAVAVAKAELDRQLKTLDVANAAALPAAVAAAQVKAATDGPAMNRLHHLIFAAEQAALAGLAPAKGVPDAAKSARAAIEKKEGADGYLRQARLPLAWSERLVRSAKRQGALVGPGLNWAAELAAKAAVVVAGADTVDFPGVVVNAFIGEPGEIAKIRGIVPVPNDLNTTIDEKFRLEVERKATETIELELTVWNHYRHPVAVAVAPRVPDGWKAEGKPLSGTIAPGAFLRGVMTVTIPGSAASGIYTLGGTATFSGGAVTEIHPQRVKVQ